MRTSVTLVLILAMLAGCARQAVDGPERTEAEQYAQVHEQIERNNFINALEELRELEARYPYGEFAEQAHLDRIYVHYRALDYPAAVASAGRFLRNYPASTHRDYALYLRGLARYNMNRGMLERLVRTDRAARDLSSWRDAFRDFQELVEQYPGSEYAPDARSRMIHIRNQLARHELHAARFYARRGAYIAAANRAQHVVEHFQRTPSVPEALAIMSRSYRELGRPELAAKSRRVLAHNWPDSEFLGGDDRVALEWWPEGERTWLRLLTFDLLG